MNKVLVVVLVNVGLLGVAQAGVVDDFREAASRFGCASFPYESERNACHAAGREVDDWCKNTSREFKCDGLNLDGLFRSIEGVNSKVAALKKEIEELDSKRSGAKEDSERKDYESKIDGRKKAVDDLLKKIEEWNALIAAERAKARDRESIGGRCLNSRLVVQRMFSDMKSRLQRESDPELKAHASRIVDKISEGERGHADAIANVNAAIEKCRAIR